MRATPLLLLVACGALRPLNETPDTTALNGDPGSTPDGDTATTDGDVDTDADADADADADTDADVQVSSVYPGFGPNGGGTYVTLVGGPFDSSAVVKFGGIAASSLPTVTSTQIVAVTPPSGATGYVDVEVDDGSASAVVPGAFQYWTDGVGKFGALGEIGYWEYKGSYWGSQHSTPPPYGFAQMWFTNPTADPYWKAVYTTAMDTCTSGYAPATSPYDPGAPSLDLTSGNKTITLDQDANYSWLYWSNTYDPVADVALGGHYDIQPMAGAAPDWPQFTGVDFDEIPSNDPHVTLPAIDGAQYATVTENNFTFNWTGPFDGSYVLILATRERPGASYYYQPVEYVSCVATDDGLFKIPAGTFAAWDTTKDAFFLAVGRAVELGGVLPYDGSTSGVVGVYWEQGFAVAR